MNAYYAFGDTSNCIRYAQLVAATPMKKYTEEGVEYKKGAQKMLRELGVRCDDPGIVVFDIRDKRTWNEGRW